jgi:two-component system, sensor histidine kinase YesM
LESLAGSSDSRYHGDVNVRLRLFLRYLASVLIPVAILVVVGLVSVFYTRRATTTELEKLHDGILFQVEQAVESFITDVDATGIAISSSSDLLVDFRQALAERRSDYSGFRTIGLVQSIINPLVYARPALHSLYIMFDDYPAAILTTEFGVVGVSDIPDTSWIDSYRSIPAAEEMVVERRLFRPLSGSGAGSQEVITIYRRLSSLTRQSLRGVVVLNVSVVHLGRLIEARRTHDGQIVTVDGPRGNRLYGSPPPDPALYQVSRRTSSDRWTYTLYTPRRVFLEPASVVFRISAWIIVAASIFGATVALVLTRRNFRHIRYVLNILENDGAGEELPEIADHSRKGFGSVTYAILRTVIEKKYLQVQLSEKALREKTLELLFLRSQMNPHFLFNTLEVINWRVLDHTGGPSEINDLINRLSEILKYALRTPSRFVSLADEIENLRHYLELQKVRSGGRIDDRWEIEPAIADARVIPMLLQPLVENAIAHGLRGSDGEVPGQVTISARREGDTLAITVADSGRGMSQVELARLRSRLEEEEAIRLDHVGLANTARRLVLAFGDAATLSVDAPGAGGFLVTIRIPYQRYSPLRDLRN